MRTIRRFTSILPLFLLILTGCDEAVGGFEEYVGVNLLEYNSGAMVHSLNSGDWMVSNATYVTLIDRSGTLPTDTAGLPSTADVSNLEIPNLADNGDFESGTTGWTTEASTSAVIINSGGREIDGNTLQYAVNDPNNQINFALSALTDGFAAGGSYRFLYSFRGTAITIFEANDGAVPYRTWRVNAEGLSNLYGFPYDINETSVVDMSAGATAFSIGSVNPDLQSVQSEGYLDNFRVVRTDVPSTTGLRQAIYLEIPLEEAGRLPLVSGTYRFSIWIREEESAEVTPTVPNTFQTNGVTLRLADLTTYGTGKVANYYRDGSWANWHQVSVELSVNIESGLLPTDPILRISVMPTIHNDMDCGIMLIAAPTLSLLP